MNPLSFTASTLLLTATLFAQATTVSPDRTCDSREGQLATNRLGWHPQGRFQILDGTMRNNAKVIKGIAFRHDHRSYDAKSGMGRTWADVTVHMSQCDVTKSGVWYSQNAVTVPKLVFKNKVSWPDMQGSPATAPSKWALDFPFASAFTFSGALDLLTDIRFYGGTLDNKATWVEADYYLDGATFGTHAVNSSSYFGKWGSAGGCADSGSTRGYGAYDYVRCWAYGPDYPTTSLRNKFKIFSGGSYFGASTSAVSALGLAANRTGVAMGASCNKLHIDTRFPFVLIPRTTNTNGSLPANYFGLPGGVTNYDPALVGADIMMQTAWSDTKSRELKLGAACWAKLPHIPVAGASMRLKTKIVYGNSLTAVGGVGFTGSHFPLIRYVH